MSRVWRRLRRIRRSNLVVTALLVVVLVLMQVLDFESEAEVFEPPEAVARSQDTPIVIPPGEPIVLGFSGPLTGRVSERGLIRANAAIAGALRWKELNGDLIHGHRVDLVGEDDGGTEEDVAVVAANLLLARPRLVGIVGPIFSATVVATIDIYADAGVIMISGSASRTDLTLTQSEPGFFFRTAFTNALEAPRQAEILIERLGTGTAFIIDDREAYGIDLAQSAVAPLRDAGWEIVRESVPQGTVDFGEIIARIDSAGADAVIYEGFKPGRGPAPGTASRQRLYGNVRWGGGSPKPASWTCSAIAPKAPSSPAVPTRSAANSCVFGRRAGVMPYRPLFPSSAAPPTRPSSSSMPSPAWLSRSRTVPSSSIL